jgi:hypothetical protein
MKSALRAVLAALAFVVIVQTLMLCGRTGWHGFTRFPSPNLEFIKQQTGGLANLFQDTGLNDKLGPVAPDENRFAFGWLPSGWGSDTVSVLTLAAPSLITLILVVCPRRAVRASPADLP